MTIIVQGVLQPTNTVKTKKKKVSFHPSINMSGYNQKQVKLQAILEIVLDARFENQLANLTGYTRFFLITLLNGGRGDPVSPDLRPLLEQFRGAGRNTLEAFDAEDLNVINALGGSDAFLNEFREYLPSQVVSSPESVSENSTGERRGEANRKKTARD